MKVKEKRPFATQRQFMKKPKPWNALKTKLSNLASSIPKSSCSKPSGKKCSLKAVVRRLKCLNASSTLFRLPLTSNHQPMYLQYSEKWENRHKKNNVPTFPFLQRNLELCVNSWSDYEKKFMEWLDICQQQKKQPNNQGNNCNSLEDHACSSSSSKHPLSSKHAKSHSKASQLCLK
uniref:Uncharacterized protein n=1 Tax=Ditylenchus dipsaci TaxID=166011 RepID=A0A915E604_9BILA